jgi:TPR repeat protein
MGMTRVSWVGVAAAVWLAACAGTKTPSPAGAPAGPPRTVSDPSLTPGERAVELHFAAAIAACERAEAPACLRLAQRKHYASNNLEVRRIDATLARACDRQVPVACAGLARSLLDGRGGAKDVPRALALLEKACAAPDAYACSQLAEVQLIGQDVHGKEAEGRRLAKESCEKLGGWPCYTDMGPNFDPKRDHDRVFKLAQRACDGGDAIACYQLGQLVMEDETGGGKVDAARATALYQKACDADMGQACFNLAWQFIRGTGAPQDEARGRELFERSCTLGDASGCDELARRGGDAERYCDLWGAEACYTAVVKFVKANGESAETAERIVLLGMRATARGSDAARNTTSHLYRDNVRSCKAGEQVKDSCTFAGLLNAYIAKHADGGSDEQAKARTAALDELGKACDAGSKPACAAQSQLAP